MRTALGTLPWVEHQTVVTDTDRREVRFNLKGGDRFHEKEARKALAAQGFPEVTVKSVPGK